MKHNSCQHKPNKTLFRNSDEQIGRLLMKRLVLNELPLRCIELVHSVLLFTEENTV